MVQISFEARMADLEQLQGPPDLILEEAAKIIGIDLTETIHQSSHIPLYNTKPVTQGFKEQWILRWLLKKIGVSDSKPKNANSDSQQRCGTLNPQPRFLGL